MDIILQLSAAAILVLSFGILFQAPKKSLVWLSITGILGWGAFLLSQNVGSYNIITSSFVASIFIALSGEIFARVLKMPVTVFVIPGIIPLVPGVPAYNTMLSLVKGEYIQGVETGIDTLLIAGAIAFAIATIGAIADFSVFK